MTIGGPVGCIRTLASRRLSSVDHEVRHLVFELAQLVVISLTGPADRVASIKRDFNNHVTAVEVPSYFTGGGNGATGCVRFNWRRTNMRLRLWVSIGGHLGSFRSDVDIVVCDAVDDPLPTLPSC